MYGKIKKAVLGMLMVAVLTCNIFVGEASASEVIFSDTVISRENIDKVCDYLGLNSSEIIWSENIEADVITVKELEQIIEKAKMNAKVGEICDNNTNVRVENNSTYAKAVSSKTLSRTFDNDGYTFKVSVSAKYFGKKFKGVGSPKVSVSTGGPITYKVYNDTLKSSYTADKVNVNGDVWISAYAGVGKIGLVKIWTQKNTVNCNWYVHIPQELRIRSRGTERHSASN